MDVTKLSVEAYDALVDAGKIKAWTGAEARRISRENLALRNRKPARGGFRSADNTGELREACRKIMAYPLKTPARRKPLVTGVPGSGQSWRG
jgi:hypothetical protein